MDFDEKDSDEFVYILGLKIIRSEFEADLISSNERLQQIESVDDLEWDWNIEDPFDINAQILSSLRKPKKSNIIESVNWIRDGF